MKRALSALVCFFYAWVVMAQAPPLPAGVERVASVEGITEYRLANGLRAVLFPDQTRTTITVNIAYLVGSRHENNGETGMAHIIEHLVSYGSPKHPDAKKEQQERGARRNATTWYDRTTYYESFPASDANLEWALDLEADRMVNAFVEQKILDSQMSVVRNEFEAGENSPADVLLRRVLSTAYLWHNYANTAIGARSDIEKVPIERLQVFYKTYYRPDNAVVVVAGKFDEAQAVKLLAAKFGGIPRPAGKIPETYTIEPAQDGERSVTLRRVGDVQELCVAYHTPAAAHPDTAALDLLARVLAASPAGRLYKALVETKKAASVGGFNFQLREPGVAIYRASVRKEASLEEARATLLRILDGVAAEPITKEEVERARTELVRQLELGLNNSEAVGMALGEFAAAGDWRLLFLHRDRLRKASVEDVQRVARTYLAPSNRTVGLFIPEAQPLRTEIPATPDVTALLKDYKGDVAVAAGEAFDPSPANVDQRAIRGQLPGGLKLSLLPKKTRGETVTGVLRLRFGDQNSLRNRSAESDGVRTMLMRGTAKRTRQQITDELNRLKARVSAGGGANFTEMSLETVRAGLPEVLKLVAEILREPSFPAEELEQARQAGLARYEAMRSDPQALSGTEMSRHMNPYPKGDIRYVATPAENIDLLKATTLEAVRQFHKDFYGASEGELSLVGDFDAGEVHKLAASLLGDWKSPKPYAEIQRPYRKIPVLQRSIETPDKANAMFLAGMSVQVGDEDQDYPALLLANYMLGGHSSSRLYTRIRAKEGLSYGVGSGLSAPARDRGGQFSVFAICAPQNAPKVEKAFREELERALKEGFASDEVASAKAGWSRGQSVSRGNDPELVRRLRSHSQYGRTMAFDADIEKKIAALTPEEIAAAFRRHIDPAQISVVRAGDFKKAGVSQ